MIGSIFRQFAGSHHKRFLKKCAPAIKRINEIEPSYASIPEDELPAKTEEFRKRHDEDMKEAVERFGADAIDKLVDARRESLDALLPEAFALVKHAAKRLCDREIEYVGQTDIWKMVHFDVQLIGGMALHSGYIAEMATGEGKTLTATLPLYLNALTRRNCQLVTVNEYLARRDAEWMGHLFRMLGLSVGVIRNMQPSDEKRAAYGADITYGTASEFGFDYLRDNGMATRAEQQVQKDHYFCIVDEVDSILIDEARTPLIISGPMADERELPFLDLKPSVSRIVQLQTRLCSKLASEARAELEKGKENADSQSAFEKLSQVKIGMPKNRTLLEIMEMGQWRNAFERFDAELNSDLMRKELYALKEQLYYTIDERHHSADLTEIGRQTLSPKDPDAFTLPDLPLAFADIDNDESLDAPAKIEKKQEHEAVFAKRSESIHAIGQLLRAYSLYERDKDYMVHEGRVIIIDQNTGRPMPGRRWSDGLHQAVEAKEGARIEKETKTYATITIQNYFRLYEKLAGMTGTAETEAGEFHDIYGLDVRVIPTNKPCIRVDDNDVIYKSKRQKFMRVVEDIQEAHGRGQPVLCGTASVITSEELSSLLNKAGIPHSVLNAKHHQHEAEIVSKAGQKGAVTIATNMAGRGTDIKLGEGVREQGGLLVLGTERHESRRIDRQLRGRCSRQGDPGRSKFFVSLEDDLMRLFANQGPIGKLLESSFEEGEELAHPLLNRSIETAQKKVEQHHYSIRKRLLQYDDVLNRQREVVYGIRNDAIHNDTPATIIHDMIREEIEDRVEAISPSGETPETSALDAMLQWVKGVFPISVATDDFDGLDADGIVERLIGKINEVYQEKSRLEDQNHLRDLERHVVTRGIDRNWQEHLTEIEELRRAVGLRGYGQKDPLVEFKTEAYREFTEMMGRIRLDIATGAFRSATNIEVFQKLMQKVQRAVVTVGPDDSGTGEAKAVRADGTEVGTATAQASPSANTTAAKKASPRQEKATNRIKINPPKPVQQELPKIGRNEIVTIRNPKTGETKETKFKKAEPLLRQQGWLLIKK